MGEGFFLMWKEIVGASTLAGERKREREGSDKRFGDYGLQRKLRKRELSKTLTQVKTSFWVWCVLLHATAPSLCIVFSFLSVLCKVFTYNLLLLWRCPCVSCGCSGNFVHYECNVAWFSCTHLLILCLSWFGCQKLAVGWEICWLGMCKKMVERDLVLWMMCFNCMFEGIFVLWWWFGS